LKSYLAITFDKNDEILLGLLSAYPFESFEEVGDDCLIGYIREDDYTAETESEIKDLALRNTTGITVERIEPQNWNELWEASFQPIEVDHFCRVRADFHPPTEGFEYDLIINPKMAFGTGHHATTYMMISAMSGVNFKNKSVLDYGCGTGILAILASKMGASQIDAVDIENESFLNTRENSEINHTENVQALCGDIHAVPQQEYDIILANINRNVLLDSCKDIYVRTVNKGLLLLSGILEEDRIVIESAFTEAGFGFKDIRQREQWLCMAFVKVG
jgi:ribosomal protein L11 methyltransferase